MVSTSIGSYFFVYNNVGRVAGRERVPYSIYLAYNMHMAYAYEAGNVPYVNRSKLLSSITTVSVL